ncbi:DUF2062 domain-containing protein [Chondromyces apiculatus]|uniref:DUF2062 domain-containing protein n=1 Tax=Chondromyces apiculatus DSM 436 TaxID=1192034 RepID=A0A017SZW6_9BACT|nr:DUF2062 domain-containing protein [Chondromyces apiculatus]EYF02130.1 Hypothetical protein CAP_7470 [Chondromyces apiculatus DSM 436]
MARFSLLREEARRAWRELRGSDLSPARGAAAVAIGLFIGSQPIFGCHTPLVLLFCFWFRLDAAIAWVAANISNPFFAPALLTAEVQVGALLKRGEVLRLDQEVTHADAWARFAGYMFLGAPVVGIALAAGGALLTWGVVSLRRRFVAGSGLGPGPYRLPPDTPPWIQAVERVASRYCPERGYTATQRARFHYTRIKLISDPVARLVADIAGEQPGALGEVLDIGTGAGQLPLLLLDLGRATRVRGTDWDEAKIADARRAAAGLPAEMWRADAREAELGEADTVLLIDLLHYFRLPEQDAILRRAAAAVRPGGRLVIREADPSRRLRSVMTLLEERVFTAIRWNRGERVRFRHPQEFVALLEALGFRCDVRSAWGKTPFSNVLILAERPPEEVGAHHPC